MVRRSPAARLPAIDVMNGFQAPICAKSVRTAQTFAVDALMSISVSMRRLAICDPCGLYYGVMPALVAAVHVLRATGQQEVDGPPPGPAVTLWASQFGCTWNWPLHPLCEALCAKQRPRHFPTNYGSLAPKICFGSRISFSAPGAENSSIPPA